jgi:DNA-binding IclR family transcriptional regulator
MQLLQLLWPGALAVQAVHVAARLGIADLLSRGPHTAAELAHATQTNAPFLDRLLRALTSLGIFSREQDGTYSQTPLSDVLRSDHEASVRSWAVMLGASFV